MHTSIRWRKPDTEERLKKHAEKQDRSKNKLICIIIEKWLDEQDERGDN